MEDAVKNVESMKKDNTLLIIAGSVAGYFLILKPILEKLGLQRTQEEVQQDQNVQDYVTQTLRKQNPTKSKGEWQIIANQVYEDLRYSAIDDNKDDAAYQVCRVQNEADVALLIETFGRRQEYLFGIPVGSKQSLNEFIRSNLSTEKIAAINNNYSRKGIKFRY